MAGSRSDLIYRYSGTCDKCTRSTAAVEAAAGALGADRKRVVHGDDDSSPKSAEIDDVERKDPTDRNQDSRFPR